MPNPTETRAGSPMQPSGTGSGAQEDTSTKLRREADEAAAAVRDETAKLGEDVRAAAETGAESLQEQAGAEMQERRFDAAEQVDAFADALRAGVESLRADGHEAMADYWGNAADSAGRFAERIRNKPLAEAWHDTEETVREEPALGFGGAMIAGFMLARFLKSSTPEASADSPSAGARRGTAPTSPGAWPRETPRTPAGVTTHRPQV
ncbi:hypothetical protein [uncultured Thiohalocapsa sp.]|uniref:hypothetical protein n=1 Tax=uncultured Thiohalocapsa sp. TaxID=768990 RepID=UPI0025E1218E|nr:hypothetical protein [uncultured Thiohalocapsa sp.]